MLCLVVSCVQLFSTLCTVAHQAPRPWGFSRQEYWSGLSFPSPGDLPDAVIELASLTSPVLAGGLFTASATWEAWLFCRMLLDQGFLPDVSLWLYVSYF